MSDVLVTKADIEHLRRCVTDELIIIKRELTEHHKRFEDREEQRALDRLALATRTRLWAAAITGIGVVLVAIIQVVSNHSFAAARENVREMNRQDRLAAEPAQAAHDELLVKRTLDERDKRIEQLIVKGLQK